MLRLGFDPNDKAFDEVRGEIAIYKKVVTPNDPVSREHHKAV
jgi:hypothetical protein